MSGNGEHLFLDNLFPFVRFSDAESQVDLQQLSGRIESPKSALRPSMSIF